jgi:hypothetical protein
MGTQRTRGHLRCGPAAFGRRNDEFWIPILREVREEWGTKRGEVHRLPHLKIEMWATRTFGWPDAGHPALSGFDQTKPESRPIVSVWVILRPYLSAGRRYVRFGFARNSYCGCADCVAHPSRVIRLGVQSTWSGVGSVAVPRSSVGVHALSIQDALSFTCRV